MSEEKTVAVIVIPGIGGSNICDTETKRGFGKDLTFTMINDHLLSNAENAVELLEQARNWQPLIRPYSADVNDKNWRGWAQLAGSYYKPFMQDCEEQKSLGFKPIVFGIGYNFTQTNLVSADGLIVRVKEILHKIPSLYGYIFVTHSMGTFPVRAALKKCLDSQLYEKCIGVIHIAAPNLGFPEVYKRFYAGVEGDFLTSLVLGISGETFSMRGCIIPSMCEILPISSYWNTCFKLSKNIAQFPPLEKIVSYVIRRYDDKKNETHITSLTKNQDDAKKFHKNLANFLHWNTAAIVLEGIPTVQSLTYKGRKKGNDGISGTGDFDFEIEITDKGDGTVPSKSQAAYVRKDLIKTISGVPHADPLSEKGKVSVFPKIYNLMQSLFEIYESSNEDKKKGKDLLMSEKFSTESSFLNPLNVIFPHSQSNFTTALANEPIFINGMKVLFDQSISVNLVNLEYKDNTLKHLAQQQSYYSSMMTKPKVTVRAIAVPEANEGLLPPEYDDLRKQLVTLRGWIGGLGLTPIDKKYREAIDDRDYEKAYFCWKDFKKRVDELSQKKGDALLKDDSLTEKWYFLRLLFDSYTSAKVDLLRRSTEDRSAKSHVPSEGLEKRGSKEVGMYGQIVPRTGAEMDEIHRFLQEAQEFKELFKDYSSEELKLSSETLVDSLQEYAKTGVADVESRIALNTIMVEMREAVKDLTQKEDHEDKEEREEIYRLYKESLDRLKDIEARVAIGEEIGSGQITLVVKKVGKKIIGIGASALSGLDPTRISKLVLASALAGNRIIRTMYHIRALKNLKRTEPKDKPKDWKNFKPGGWKETIDFIVNQKTAKVGTSSAGVAGVVPGVGYVLNASIAVHNRATKDKRKQYSKDLLDWYSEGDYHAGLIILELVGIDNFRIFTKNKSVDELADKMAVQ